ncbi:hypothetical protein TNCV_930041 [Trichonephila clavipes]|uniref:Uncharacterized protein n=1 Tax=Trichonephila clavipes TaxID=2585209 RepID=A0A8X6W2D2_TRICX|nr:hypothetical protein TNCV_930041 [Trichonephila clavipes]
MAPITGSRECRHVTRITLMDHRATPRPGINDWGRLQGNKCLLEQFHDVFRSMDSQLGDHDCVYHWHL